MNNTNKFYNTNAKNFFENTINASMKEQYGKFEKYLSTNSSILEIGSGSGRDAFYFRNKGYNIFPTDISEELIKLAKEKLNIKIHNVNVLDLDFNNKFDSIWACASLLHINSNDLFNAFKKLNHSMKKGGHMYASFKYGTFEGERNGRFFNDMNESKILPFIQNLFEIEEIYITEDVRPDRSEKWLNIIIRKI